MSLLRKAKRSLFSTLLAILVVGVTLITLTAVRVYSFLFRQNIVAVAALKFPVLVLQPGGERPFAEWDSVALRMFSKQSTRTPVEGSILIDSAFNVFVQENVRRKREGDFKWMARYLLPQLRVKYRFDLRRLKARDRDEALDRLMECKALSDDAFEADALRNALATQFTLTGMLEVLKLYQPIEPTPMNVQLTE